MKNLILSVLLLSGSVVTPAMALSSFDKPKPCQPPPCELVNGVWVCWPGCID